mgnify:CR=1 FL=1
MTPSQQFDAWWPTQPQGWGTHKETERRAWLAAYAAGREAGFSDAYAIAKQHDHVCTYPPCHQHEARKIMEAIHQARSQP